MDHPIGQDGRCRGLYAGNGSIFIDWQPGNGTSYKLLFTKLKDAVCAAIGAQHGSHLVTRVNGFPGLSQPLAPGGVLHYSYILEKFGSPYGRCGVVDASEIAKVAGAILGRKAVVCTDDKGEYDEAMEVVDA